MILKVARLGHPVIRTQAHPVDPAKITTPEFQALLDDMVETMREYNGVGLAAPQVHLALQLAVLEVENHPRYPDMPSVPLTYLINPKRYRPRFVAAGRMGRLPEYSRTARTRAALQATAGDRARPQW